MCFLGIKGIGESFEGFFPGFVLAIDKQRFLLGKVRVMCTVAGPCGNVSNSELSRIRCIILIPEEKSQAFVAVFGFLGIICVVFVHFFRIQKSSPASKHSKRMLLQIPPLCPRPDGNIFEREAILECLLQQKLDIQAIAFRLSRRFFGPPGTKWNSGEA